MDSNRFFGLLAEPRPRFIEFLAANDLFGGVAREVVQAYGDKLAEHPVGTGPFKFLQWARDEKLVVVRNDDYWKGKAEIKKVTFRFIPEFSARLAALLAGEIDIMKDVPPQNVEMLEKSGKARLRATVSSRINYLALVNLKPGPMQDIRVRKAIHASVNVDELIQQVLRGRASKMCGPLSPINVDFSPKVQCLKYDVAHAKNLLKAANIDPGRLTLTLDTPSGRYPLDKDVSLATALGREYGVPMRLANLALEEITEALGRGWGDRDSSSFMLLEEERAGVEIKVPRERLQQILEQDGR